MEGLGAIDRRFAQAVDASAAIALDDEWHRALLDRCPNRTLVEILGDLIRRTHRYELGVMAQPEVLRTSSRRHQEIADALRTGDLAQGCRLLGVNLSGLDPVLRWLRSRPN